MDQTKPLILLVEDEVDVRQGLAALLQPSYNILEAGTGMEALRLYEENQMDLAVVLLDIRLPDMGGLDILKAMKLINLNPDIIMATAIKDQATAISAMQEGATDYLVKPFLNADLQAAIRRSLVKHDYRRKIREVKELSEKSAVLSERRDILAQEKEMKAKIMGHNVHPLERYTFFDQLDEKYSYEDIVRLLETDLKERTVSDEGLSSSRVLIVEDEPDIQSSLKDLLSDSCQIGQAFSGREALDLLLKEKFDVVLLDIRLPDLTGIEVLQQFQKSPGLNQEAQFIMTTALKDVQSAIDAFRYGAFDYLTKPIRIDDIQRGIQKAVKQKNYKKVLSGLLAKLRRQKASPEKRRTLLEQFIIKQRSKKLPVTISDVLTFFPEYYTGDLDPRLILPEDSKIEGIIFKLAAYHQKKQEESAQGLDLPAEVPDYIKELVRQRASGRKND